MARQVERTTPAVVSTTGRRRYAIGVGISALLVALLAGLPVVSTAAAAVPETSEVSATCAVPESSAYFFLLALVHSS